MKQLPPFPQKYFDKFSVKPVQLKPYHPKSTVIAKEYMKKLHNLLNSTFPDVEIVHRGSTAFEILGKGDIEFGLYITEECWYEVIFFLINHYKGIGNLEQNYARFNDGYNGYEIEVILFTGYSADLDKKVTNYMKASSQLLKDYELLKQKYSYSKREYQIQKDIFFRKIIDMIPE